MFNRRSFIKAAFVSVAALSTVSLTSCSEDEDSIKKKYIGIWRGCESTAKGEKYDKNFMDSMSADGNYTILGIDERGNWVSSSSGSLMGGTWALEKSKIVLTNSYGENYELEIKDGKITLPLVSDITITFEKDSDTLMGQSDYVGKWRNPDTCVMFFNTDGSCSIVDEAKNRELYSGTYRVDSGICTYNLEFGHLGVYTKGSFSGTKFTVTDLPKLTFEKDS